MMLLILLALQAPAALPAPLPADVRRFVARYESSEHWLGEEGYDAERAREIARAIRSECTGIDAQRARLLRRYRAPSPARRRLVMMDALGA
jgi:hypothetical protein